jgi:uncharacterized membrane protein YhaH (DUF805 family)
MSASTGAPGPSPVPLSEPDYKASIGTAFSRFWRKYTVFTGRASRSEFWWWAVISLGYAVALEAVSVAVGATAPSFVNGAPADGPVYYVILGTWWAIWLITLVPGLALSWRRLHDTNRSGAYYLLGLIPLAGPIILLVMLGGATKSEGRRFDTARA